MSNKQKFENLLLEAEQAEPNNTFIKGCRKYFEAKGYLSIKQVEALEEVTGCSIKFDPEDNTEVT